MVRLRSLPACRGEAAANLQPLIDFAGFATLSSLGPVAHAKVLIEGELR
jgi:hypothetical protein